MQIEVGAIVDGVVTGITKFGAFVSIGENTSGLVHISEISNRFVKEVSDVLQNGQQVKVKILGTNENGKLNLSIRQANSDAPSAQNRPPRRSEGNNRSGSSTSQTSPKANRSADKPTNQPAEFEDMLSKFMHSSDEKLSGMRKQPNNRRGAYQKKGSYNK